MKYVIGLVLFFSAVAQGFDAQRVVIGGQEYQDISLHILEELGHRGPYTLVPDDEGGYQVEFPNGDSVELTTLVRSVVLHSPSADLQAKAVQDTVNNL